MQAGTVQFIEAKRFMPVPVLAVRVYLVVCIFENNVWVQVNNVCTCVTAVRITNTYVRMHWMKDFVCLFSKHLESYSISNLLQWNYNKQQQVRKTILTDYILRTTL